MERAGYPPDSHGGKALAEVLDTYPRDELFQIGPDELFDQAMAILSLQDRQRLRLLVRRDDFGRFVSLPRLPAPGPPHERPRGAHPRRPAASLPRLAPRLHGPRG